MTTTPTAYDGFHPAEPRRVRRALVVLVGLLLSAFAYSLGYQVGWQERGLGGGVSQEIENDYVNAGAGIDELGEPTPDPAGTGWLGFGWR